MTTKGTDNRFRSLTVVGESGTPSTPGSGDFKLYVADDGTFYIMDDTGTPTALGGGGLSDPMTTRGDIIIRNASNVTARLGIGSAGKVLSSDGTDISWQTPAAAGQTLLEQHTASSSATLDFTSWYSSTYDDYIVRFVSILNATDAANFTMQVSTNGGSTWSSSTYNWSYVYLLLGSTTTGVVNGASDSSFHLANANKNASSGTISGRLDLINPGGSQNKSYLYEVTQENSGDTNIYRYGGGGQWATTTAINGLRFAFSSGNIASGTIRIYGVAK